jgi:hypothetical protein
VWRSRIHAAWSYRAMKEILQILLGIIAVSVFVLLYLRFLVFDAWCEQTFGFSVLRRRTKPAKVEIQSLFDGNTKDQDQI